METTTMSNQLKKHQVGFSEKKLIITNGKIKKEVEFPSPIKQIEKFEQVIIVRIYPKTTTTFLNENIFGVSYDGKILWQIEVVSHVHVDSPYTWIGRKDSLLEAYNWDGTLYIVDPNNGKIIDERFIK